MIILHNSHDKTSRDFVVAHGAGHTVIDWYVDSAARAAYLAAGNPAPSAFPSVIDGATAIGAVIARQPETLAAATAAIAATVEEDKTRLIAAVRLEAERRIAVGILVDDKPFRCDEASTLRLRELANGLAEADPGATQKFRTAAGHRFEVEVVEAEAIADAQRAYRGALLARSDELQEDPPANPAADEHWPARPNISLST